MVMVKMTANRLMLDANRRGGGGADIADMHKDPTVSVLWKGTKRRQISIGFGWCQNEIFIKAHLFFLYELIAKF
jgi:hypothetical protein